MGLKIKYFSQFCLAVSILIFIYTFYRSEIYWNGNKRDYYFFYYIISTFLIFLFLIIIFFLKSEKIKLYFYISLISLICSLYIFEIYLSFLDWPNNKKILNYYKKYKNKNSKVKFEKKSRMKFYKNQKKKFPNIVMTVPRSAFLEIENLNLFPLSGVSNQKTIYCNENGYYLIYQSDKFGFNNPSDEWDQKEIEYLIIGDSTAHGACINRPYDISSVLRTISNKNVINLGYSASGPLIQYATLKEYFPKNSKVKNIIWLYQEENDQIDLKNELNNKILNKYFLEKNFSQDLEKKQKEIDDITERIISVEEERYVSKKNIKLIKLYATRTLILSYLNKLNKKKDVAFKEYKIQKEFKNIVELMTSFANKKNSKIYFVYLPSYYRYKNNAYQTYQNENYKVIQKTLKEFKITLIDLHQIVFDKEKDPLELFPFKLHGHYNSVGHAKVAQTIYELTNY